MTILRASSRLESAKAFIELYVHAYSLVKEAEKSHKTVVLGAMSPKNGTTMEENFRILTEHSETLATRGWAVLDLVSFQPHVERLLKQKKKQGYPYTYLYNFSLPLITSGVFRTIHFCKNYSESHGATFKHIAAKRCGIPVVYLD